MRIRTIIALIVLTCGLSLSHGSLLDGVAKRHEHTSNRKLVSHDDVKDDLLIAQVPMSNVCYTQYFYCILPRYVPVGTACWCASPNGPIGGVVR